MSSHFLQPKKILKATPEPHPQFLNTAFLDPYSGCEFGCLYCHGVKEDINDKGRGPSPFKVGVKTSSAFCLKNELAGAKSGEIASVGIGFASDPYQPCEKEFRLSERCLELLRDSALPVQIITKSDLVLRDKAILSELSRAGRCTVTVSLFSLKDEYWKMFEPRAPSPESRLALIKALRRENITCGAALMPIFPYLTDSQGAIAELFEALRDSGALYCVPGVLSLTHAHVRGRIFKILRESFPRELDLYEALYDKMGRPALNYCQRIEKLLQECSEKFDLPTALPVAGLQGKRSIIFKDAL